MNARPRIPSCIDTLLYDELENVIEQARFSREDADIASMYLLEAIPQIEIAVTLGVCDKTIRRRLPGIIQRLEQTASRMGYI